MKKNDAILKHNYSRLYWILPPALLATLSYAFYYPSLNYAFQFDDLANIVKMFGIRHETFKHLFFTGTRWISYWINATAYGLDKFNPFYFRLINVSIHTATGLLIFYVIYSALKNLRKESFFKAYSGIIAFVTAGLFLLHPVQTQTISYVIQGQLEGMATLTIILMIFCFMKAFQTQNSIIKYFLIAMTWILGVLSSGTKEIAIISPVLILIFDWFFIAQGDVKSLKKRWWAHLGNFTIVFSAYLYLMKAHFFKDALGLKINARNNIGNIITENPGDKIEPLHYLISEFKVILHYLFMFIWPFNISIEYDWMLAKGFFALDSFLPFCGLCAIGFTIFKLLQKNIANPIAFGFLWFFAAIAPRSTIIPSCEMAVDYKTYVASFGWLFVLACAIVWLSSWLIQKIKFSNQNFLMHHAATAAVLLLAGTCTIQQNKTWRSGLEFWGNMIKQAPGKARAYNNYGVELAQLQRHTEAIPYFKKAVQMDKIYPDPYNNLAVSYSSTGKLDEAINAIQNCLKINPRSPEGYNNIASLLIQKNELEKAEVALKNALLLRPHYGRAMFNYGRLRLMQNKTEDAKELFRKCCMEGDLDNAMEGFAAYGTTCLNLKDYDQAIFALNEALKYSPRQPNLNYNLGNAYFFKQEYQKAIEYFDKELSLNPNDVRCLFNKGETLFTLNKYEDAAKLFNNNQVKNFFPHALIRLAACNEKQGKILESRKCLEECITTKKDAKIIAMAQNYLNQLHKVYPILNNIKVVENTDSKRDIA
ncbi:MAG: Tetratricopeptide TPR_2 repeat protein [candidate division TM6 bacterium GW2011_GWF2_32_72]|nr:MAG: Tetratricopeptide TPR_2 repeat protein [candidate division TM6 bacterium GW2011_GWF2_32_72]